MRGQPLWLPPLPSVISPVVTRGGLVARKLPKKTRVSLGIEV